MSYKNICPNCKGNGYVKVTDNKGKTNVHQCWMCESEGQVKWTQTEGDDVVTNTYFHKWVQ